MSASAPSADTLVSRALAAHQRGDLGSASRDYSAALSLSPQHPHALHYLGVIAYQRGEPAQALPMLERAIALQPHEPEFHNNLGLVLAALDRNAQAARCAPAGARVEAGSHRRMEQPRARAARAERPRRCDRCIPARARAGPQFAQARWNLALALLHDGRFAEGWPAYETRLSIPSFATATPTTPRWDGRDPKGRTILLVAEQGLGDAIHFVRLARRLADRGVRVVVQCAPSLLRLFRTVDAVDDVVATGDPLPPHDAWMPMLSLAGLLGIDASNLPADVPYLHADTRLERDVAAALAEHGGVTRIGVAWTGNRANTNDRRRSIPLATVASLFDMPGTRWFSLQKGDDTDPENRAEDLQRLARLPWRNDFDGIAAMVMQLDLVVTVDTSIAHVAGALARPVFILLPFMSDWRWRVGRSDSDWYPTATLFRQPSPGDWPGALAALRNAFSSRSAAQRV